MRQSERDSVINDRFPILSFPVAVPKISRYIAARRKAPVAYKMTGRLAALLILGVPDTATLPAATGPEVHVPLSGNTIIDLQPFRRESSIAIRDTRNAKGIASLINLNPGIDSWNLLRLDASTYREKANTTTEQKPFFERPQQADRIIASSHLGIDIQRPVPYIL